MDQTTEKESLPIVEETLEGAKLLEAIVNLSGLPEGEAHAHLDQILEGYAQVMPETRAEPVTLDTLRAAMMEYLEGINAEMQAAEQSAEGQMTSSADPVI